MDRKKITELINLCGTNSILVINEKGIFRIFCPFKVECINSVDCYSIGEIVSVIAVKLSPEMKLVYIINSKGFYHNHFTIIQTPTDLQTSFS